MPPETPPTDAPTFPARPRPSRLWPIVALVLGLALIATAAFLVISLTSLNRLSNTLTPKQSFTVSGPTIAQVQALSLLTVETVHVVSELEAEASFRKGTWVIRGDGDYAVDFARAQLISRDEATKHLTIQLPAPALRNPRLDEQRTKLVTYEKTGLGWWTIGALGSREDFEKTSRPRLQQAVELACRDEQFLPVARTSAERLVRSMFELAGWKVDIEWTAPHTEPHTAAPISTNP